MEAIYQRYSGWRDHKLREETVTILGFVESTVHQAHGQQRCVVAVIADERGQLRTAELGERHGLSRRMTIVRSPK